MLETLKKNVLIPMATRLGTLVAGALVSYGVHAQSAETLSIGIIGLGLVACDLVAEWLRKRGER